MTQSKPQSAAGPTKLQDQNYHPHNPVPVPSVYLSLATLRALPPQSASNVQPSVRPVYHVPVNIRSTLTQVLQVHPSGQTSTPASSSGWRSLKNRQALKQIHNT
ncbi:hypothetical protein HYQ46_007698 [Verticillium longisporum]|nr:hypothetical protein HYQ46_007698 [Verticillium longisporum]